MMKRLEQLESTQGVIEMYELLVHRETVLNGCKKSGIRIIKKKKTKYRVHLRIAIFYHVFFSLGDKNLQSYSIICIIVYIVIYIYYCIQTISLLIDMPLMIVSSFIYPVQM